MKVFSIEPDVEQYQIILPDSKSDLVMEMLEFDGHTKKENWKPIEFYIDNPLKKKGDFFSFINPSAFACNQKAADKLGRFWNLCSELLPIYLEDNTPLFIVNVIDCVNVLDRKNIQFHYYEDGTRSNRILKYSFHRHRFHESTVFKIPEQADTLILTYEGIRAPEDEFITCYEQSGLQGLKFELLFSDE